MTEESEEPTPPRVPEVDISAIKLTRGTSCVLCQQRKVRCDKNKPCSNCVKARVECRVIPPQPPRRRKKRLQEKDLVDRLKKYESLLTEHGVKFESIASELKNSEASTLEDVTELETDFEGLKTSPGYSTSPSVDSSRRSQSEKPYKWYPFHQEFRASEQLLQDSSEEEDYDGSTIHHAFDKMYENQDGFPFIIGGRSESISHLHPTAIQIFQLWQTYIVNINPLLRITHIPTVQGQIIEATAQIDKIPVGIEALMFAIYLMAITSIEDEAVRKLFGESKHFMVSKLHSALQQALINAGFMRTNELVVLQAYMLYLIAVRQFMDPRQIFCLIGIAVRVGQRMGLHRDPAPFRLSPFEVEERRRLWWTIVGYDRRIGEMTGSTVTALSSGGDCKLPLNINDTDLHINGKDAPTPHSGPSEMLFCLTRLELATAVASDSQRDNMKPAGQGDGDGVPVSAKPIPTIRIANQGDISYTLDGFCLYMESQYLKHCDPKIPLHFFTLTMTRQSLCKMKVLAFLVRMGAGEAHPLNEAERQTLFLEAIQMIEYDNILQSAESLRGYKWYTYLHFPFPAYMFLVSELRQRTMGAIVERAWDAITENHELRGLMNNLHNPMHLAFGNLFVKAWDAHSSAMEAAGKPVEAPVWIVKLRNSTEDRAGRGMGAGAPRRGVAPAQGGSTSISPPGSHFSGHGGENEVRISKALGPNQTRIDMQPQQGVSAVMPPPMVNLGPSFMGDPVMAGGQTEVQDMDWSYIMNEYNVGALSTFGAYGFPPGSMPGAQGNPGGFPGGT